MAKVIWSPDALDDLDAIAAYIARDSVDHAALLASRVIEATDALARFPRLGHYNATFRAAGSRKFL